MASEVKQSTFHCLGSMNLDRKRKPLSLFFKKYFEVFIHFHFQKSISLIDPQEVEQLFVRETRSFSEQSFSTSVRMNEI